MAIGLQLHVADTNATSGTIPISWCVSKETLDYLKEHGVKDPQVVIVVVPAIEGNLADQNYLKEIRYVVPLSDLMTYVEFNTPGKNRIWAFVAKNSRKYAKDDYLCHRGLLSGITDYYSFSILSDDGERWSSNFCLYEIDGKQYRKPDIAAEPLLVDVPKECFAPEPPEWEKAWTNLFFESKCADQCHYRRRRMFAYSVQPFIMFGSTLIRLFLFIIGLLVGARGISFKYLLHPLTYDLRECGIGLFDDGSIFIRETKWTEIFSWWILRKIYLMPLMPIFVIPICILLYFHLWLAVFVIILAFATVAFALFITGLADRYKASIEKFNFGVFFNWFIRLFIVRKADQDKDDQPWYFSSEEETAAIVCDGKKKKPLAIAQLPPKHRTIKLRFFDLKAKICKPFAR